MGRRKKRMPTYVKIDKENLDHLVYNMKTNPSYDNCDVSIKITNTSRERLRDMAKSMHHNGDQSMRYEDVIQYLFLMHHKYINNRI